jgi:hypothetical protein
MEPMPAGSQREHRGGVAATAVTADAVQRCREPTNKASPDRGLWCFSASLGNASFASFLSPNPLLLTDGHPYAIADNIVAPGRGG